MMDRSSSAWLEMSSSSDVQLQMFLELFDQKEVTEQDILEYLDVIKPGSTAKPRRKRVSSHLIHVLRYEDFQSYFVTSM